ncbi:MAG TPA: hypothetical protein VFX38_07690 [Gammaproteobacteria bacterium]|nr:hypothetical protein [Gammaproteobacteria bacterium]
MNRRIGSGNMARALAGGPIAAVWPADALAPTVERLGRARPLPLSIAAGMHTAALEESARDDFRGLVARAFPRARDPCARIREPLRRAG